MAIFWSLVDLQITLAIKFVIIAFLALISKSEEDFCDAVNKRLPSDFSARLFIQRYNLTNFEIGHQMANYHYHMSHYTKTLSLSLQLCLLLMRLFANTFSISVE